MGISTSEKLDDLIRWSEDNPSNLIECDIKKIIIDIDRLHDIVKAIVYLKR